MENRLRLLEINVVCGHKSTGRIATEIAKDYEKKGYEVKIAYGRDGVPDEYKSYGVKIGNSLDLYSHVILSRLFDSAGFESRRATKRFLKWATLFNPDVWWLHNLHGYYINVEMLFAWIKSRPNMQVFWTLHDCWAFTGHCTHFSLVGCERWEQGCYECPIKCNYPKSILADRSKKNYERKKQIFTQVDKMTIYTPSKWLQDRVERSFLRGYDIQVLPNQVDKTIFHPVNSNIREKYKIDNSKVLIISVASTWTKSKGLDDLISLSTMLDSNRFQILVVGLTESQIRSLNGTIKGIGPVDVDTLVKLYSASDILLSTSKEETFGLTILEAALCGTKSIVYRDTACEEVALSNGGVAVECNIKTMYEAIMAQGIERL